MAWDFETEPDFQEKLDWMDAFVREEVEPLDLAFREPAAAFDRTNPIYKRITAPLKAEVKRRGLWACHLGPELGGPGYGQLKLALMNEILGRSNWAPNVFGCQRPTPATRRSSRTTARPRRRRSTCSRSSTATSSRASR
jgi:acyl-CoA dehydrogenase